MPESDSQLVPQEGTITAPAPNPFRPTTFDEAVKLANKIADAGFFGLTTGAKVLTMMKVAEDDKTTFTDVTRRYHATSDGKLAQKAAYTQSEFKKVGWIIWHLRTNEACVASFGKGAISDASRERAKTRWKLAYEAELTENLEKRTQLLEQVSDLTDEDEVTIVRTMQEAEESGVALMWDADSGDNGEMVLKPSWKSSPRQMLHARCLTEGVNVIDSGITAGGHTEDELDAPAKRATEGDKRADLRSKLEAEAQGYHDQGVAATDAKERSRLFGLREEVRGKIDALDATSLKEAKPIPPAANLQRTDDGVPKPSRSDDDQLDLSPSPISKVVIADAELLPSDEPAWKKYRIKLVKSNAFKGKTLEEIPTDDLGVLYKKRVEPFLGKPDVADDILAEAKMIALAYRDRCPQS